MVTKAKEIQEQLPQELPLHAYESIYEVEEVHWWFTGRRRILSGFVAEICRKIKGRPCRILDVGCGTGGNLKMLARHGEAEGVDVSPEAIAFCRSRGLENVRVSTAEDLPYTAGTFDLVTAFDVLEHLDSDAAALREMRRVLRPDGRILLFVPTFMFLWGVHDDVMHHRRRYTLPQLERVVSEAGFCVERATYANIIFFAPILLVRTVLRILRLRVSTENDIGLRGLNGVMGRIFGLEGPLLRRMNLPFGVSALCVARRIEEQGGRQKDEG